MSNTEKERLKSPLGSGKSTHSSSVQFKGRPGAIELILDEDAPIFEILQDLASSLKENHELISKRPIRLTFGKRPVDQLQFNEVKKILEQYHLKIQQMELESIALSDYLECAFGVPVLIKKPPVSRKKAPVEANSPRKQTGAINSHPQPQRKSVPHNEKLPSVELPSTESNSDKTVPSQPAILDSLQASEPQKKTHAHDEHTNSQSSFPSNTARLAQASVENKHSHTPTFAPPANLMPLSAGHSKQNAHRNTGELHFGSGTQLHKIMRTCRAGSAIDVIGDVVVFGDINQGAEIRATGDILVFGTLRGIAHAGSQGSEKAMIVAFELKPTQLRIGSQIAIAPPSEAKKNKNKPELEMAFLNEKEQIQVESYQGRVPAFLQKFNTKTS